MTWATELGGGDVTLCAPSEPDIVPGALYNSPHYCPQQPNELEIIMPISIKKKMRLLED